MVFAKLPEREKDAFFSLLDEYFQSRPEILAALSGQGGNNHISNHATSIANSVGQRAFSAAAPVAASAAASSFAKRNFGNSRNAPDSSHAAQDHDSALADSLQPVAGRVAAAAAAFATQQTQHQRGPSSSSGTISNKLSSVDTSSLKNVFGNRGSQNVPPPAYNKATAPPPVVRSPPQADPEPEEEEEEQAEGEWGEALYDYVSDEPGDLNIRENQRIWITERNSDDWWTGEVDGKSGLFPASYIKLL